MSLLYLLLLFVFGAIVGSFVNVVAWRYKPGSSVFSLKKLSGRSRCPYCSKQLSWIELVPFVSFAVQGRKCRTCKHRLSWQYPLVEFLSGSIFVVVPWFLYRFYNAQHIWIDPRFFWGLVTFWVLVFLIWLLITIIDIRHYLVPNGLNVALGVIGVLIAVSKNAIVDMILPFHNSFLRQYQLILSPSQDVWFNHITGAVVGGLFFTGLILLGRGRAMGWGDAKLAVASGLVIGWPEMGLSILLAFVIGGAFASVLLVLKKKSMKDKLPFAPFLISGFVISIFFGASIIQWYLGLFGV